MDTADFLLMGSILVLILRIVGHAAVFYTLTVFIFGLDPNARYHGINDNHFPDVTNVAWLIPVDKGTVLFSDIFELDTLFVVVFSSIIKNELIMISVHRSEFTQTSIIFFFIISLPLLILLQRYQIVTALLERHLFSIENKDFATVVFLQIQVVTRSQFVHGTLVSRDAKLKLPN